ncbi:MAG: NADH-quinone oxidoreductase subunit M [Thaumarchaeota archaeon]|jgi:proton-translocating NADH-quinone oxidoreductase chain M|nr:NADH-quinone oxidoreductase subunit M [Candidatus Geocrenenecus arthurdayi]
MVSQFLDDNVNIYGVSLHKTMIMNLLNILSVDFSETLNSLIFFTLTSALLAVFMHKNRERIVEAYVIMGFLVTFFLSIRQFFSVSSSGPVKIYASQYQLVSSQIFVDNLSIYIASIFVFIGLMASIFSVKYIEERKREYYPLLIAMVTGMVGVVFSGDFVTLFIFWEMMSLTAYVLVAFFYNRWEAVEASFKYLIMSTAGTASILFGLSLLYGMAGTLSFTSLAEILRVPDFRNNSWTYLSIALLVTGFGVNAAMAPFHSWLPDAHPAAPSPISAMLSGVVIKTGVYAMYRTLTLIFPLTLYNWQIGLTLFAVATMIVGNTLAMLQNDIKRLLAFSSIAHIGYIVFALAIGTIPGLTGGLLHILNHASMKALLFLSAGALIHTVKTRDLDTLSGIGRKMPITVTCFSIGAFSLAGVPGLNSFVSEFQIITAAIDAKLYIYAAIMIFNVLLGAAYYLRVVQILFVRPPTDVSQKAVEASPIMLTPLIILSILAVTIGVYPGPFVETLRKIAENLLSSS